MHRCCGPSLATRSTWAAPSAPRALQFLLCEERTLFIGAAGAPAVHAGDEVEWIAPGRGFIFRHFA
jgi:hypothetical protein